MHEEIIQFKSFEIHNMTKTGNSDMFFMSYMGSERGRIEFFNNVFEFVLSNVSLEFETGSITSMYCE